MGSDLRTSGSSHLSLPGRYAQESHQRATVENDFMVLKKVRARVSCSTRILSTYSAQSPVWAGRQRAADTLMLPAGVPPGKGTSGWTQGPQDKIQLKDDVMSFDCHCRRGCRGSGRSRTGWINQGRLPEGSVGQCEAKESAEQGRAAGGRSRSPEMDGGCWAVWERNSWARVGSTERKSGTHWFVFLSPGCG